MQIFARLRHRSQSSILNPRSAFTLIEVVVALGLGVVLLVAVQSMVVHAYRSSVAIEEEGAQRSFQDLPFELLAQDLANLPAGAGLSLRGQVLSFNTMNAMQSDCVVARHAVDIEYAIERSADGAVRLKRLERELDEQRAPAAGVTLAAQLESASIEIFDKGTWHDTWPLPTPRTAMAVRLTITWPDGEPQQQIIRLAPLVWRRHDG